MKNYGVGTATLLCSVTVTLSKLQAITRKTGQNEESSHPLSKLEGHFLWNNKCIYYILVYVVITSNTPRFLLRWILLSALWTLSTKHDMVDFCFFTMGVCVLSHTKRLTKQPMKLCFNIMFLTGFSICHQKISSKYGVLLQSKPPAFILLCRVTFQKDVKTYDCCSCFRKPCADKCVYECHGFLINKSETIPS